MKRCFCFWMSRLSVGLLLLACAVIPAQGAVTFVHTSGYAGNVGGATGADNYTRIDGLQPVHENRLVLYAVKGEKVTLTPPAASSRYGFRRWFSYTNGQETAVNGLSCTAGFATDKGWVVLGSQTYPTITFDGTPALVYCDQSNYTDYADNSMSGYFLEGTLQQRVVFDIRPASEMASQIDGYYSTTRPGATEKYMEEYARVAPKGRTLYFGPEYQFTAQEASAYANYYYYNDYNKNIANLSDATWYWSSTTLGSDDIINDQYIETTYSGNAETVVYTLTAQATYSTGRGRSETRYYRIAKFTVTYVNPAEYGPIANPTMETLVGEMDTLAYRDFNYNKPGTSNPVFFPEHISWEESSYGFFYETLGTAKLRAIYDANSNDPYYGDYAFLNNCNTLNASWFERNVYNHGATGTAEDAKEGYFLYVDGAQKPGTCFSMVIHADLCAGVTLWFSAYVAVLNNAGNSPLINLAIAGMDNDGTLHPITTFVSGELDNVVRGKWLRILCPLKLDESNLYPSYRLVITNKGKGSGGNDFAIDDVGLFVTEPNVVPLQASGAVCVATEGDDLTTYLHVAYEEGNMQGGSTLYYQWTEEDGSVVDMPYYGRTGNEEYGQVTLPTGTPQQNVYQDLHAFDTYASQPTVASAIGYVQENGKWVLYIATRAHLIPEHTYEGSVAASVSGLISSKCGVYSQLRLKGSMYMSINRERLLSGQEVSLCGNRMLTFGVERLVISSTATGMQEQKAVCSADWLWGTPEWVDAHTDAYGADFETIRIAIDAAHNGSEPALLAELERKGLLVRNKIAMESYLTADMDLRKLFYTAFPIDGTGYLLDARGNMTTTPVAVCTDPVVGEVTLVMEDNNIVRIGDTQDKEGLPDFVTATPRTVRISYAECQTDKITLPVYYKEDITKTFRFDYALLTATNDPNAKVGELQLPLSDAVITKYTKKITLTGTAELSEGYEYVFSLREKSFDTDDCDQGELYFRLLIVPDRVVWSPSADGAWNNDANWRTVDGKTTWCPTPSTDVILPAGNNSVPLAETTSAEYQREDVLMETGAGLYLSYDINYAPYSCRNIYVPAGTALLNQHQLNLGGKAVVEMSVPTNEWVLCAMPVSGGVSGDFWAPSAGESSDPFAVKTMHQTAGTPASDRLDNQVWQSLYNKSMTNRGDNEVPVVSSEWTDPLNAVNTPYPAGTGIALWVESAKGGDAVIFRLPKSDTGYGYFSQGVWREGPMETVVRGTDAGKPAYRCESADKGMTVTLENYDGTGDKFLLGNPTFAYIDMEKLVAGNAELGKKWYVLTEGSQELTANMPGVSADGADHTLLAPMRGLLVERQTAGATLQVTITPDMLTLPQTPASRRVKAAERTWATDALYVSATADGFTSRAVVQTDGGTSDKYAPAEDAMLFLMDQWKTPFGIYTLSEDNMPLSINRISTMDRIPLACYAQQTTGEMTIGFEGEEDYVSDWQLYDAATDTHLPLFAGLTLPLQLAGNGYVRYYLERRTIPGPPTALEQEETGVEIYAAGKAGGLTVCANRDMEQVTVYDVPGRIVATAANAGRQTEWQLPQGVYVVEVRTRNARKAMPVVVR